LYSKKILNYIISIIRDENGDISFKHISNNDYIKLQIMERYFIVLLKNKNNDLYSKYLKIKQCLKTTQNFDEIEMIFKKVTSSSKLTPDNLNELLNFCNLKGGFKKGNTTKKYRTHKKKNKTLRKKNKSFGKKHKMIGGECAEGTNNQCIICLDDLNDTTFGECVTLHKVCNIPHNFHRDCILNWKESKIPFTCPICNLKNTSESPFNPELLDAQNINSLFDVFQNLPIFANEYDADDEEMPVGHQLVSPQEAIRNISIIFGLFLLVGLFQMLGYIHPDP
jgi:hypothetical protein